MQESTPRRTVLSLFTGAGGLDLGLETAGFENVLCVEIDKDARQTLSTNRPHWKLSEPGDIHQLTPAAILNQANLKPGELTLLAGGPPCQPFSKAGYGSLNGARRLDDPRAKTLKAYLDVVEATLPQALLLENVKGIKAKGRDDGYQVQHTWELRSHSDLALYTKEASRMLPLLRRHHKLLPYSLQIAPSMMSVFWLTGARICIAASKGSKDPLLQTASDYTKRLEATQLRFASCLAAWISSTNDKTPTTKQTSSSSMPLIMVYRSTGRGSS